MATHRRRQAKRATEAPGPATAEAAAAAGATMRLDKWLWAARFYKTRELAQTAIEAGRVKGCGERVKPAHPVRIGQRYEVTREGLSWTIEVRQLSDRRGPAAAAALLYAEDEASAAERARIVALNRAAGHSPLKGRPTKRQRRKIEDFLAEP